MNKCPKCKRQLKDKVTFCPSCGEKLAKLSAGEKKARLTRKSSNKKLIFLTAGTAAAASIFVLLAFFFISRPEVQGINPAKVTKVTFPVSTFDDGKARYYRHESLDGREIRLFILKSSDGVIRAAFDACDVCYSAGKGYRQEGDFMVCNNCDQMFESNYINVLRGGCNPAPLEREIRGDKLMIRMADILAGSRYF